MIEHCTFKILYNCLIYAEKRNCELQCSILCPIIDYTGVISFLLHNDNRKTKYDSMCLTSLQSIGWGREIMSLRSAEILSKSLSRISQCMSTHVCTCAQTHTNIHTQILIYIHIYTCARIHIYTFTHIHMYTCTYIHAHMHTLIDIHTMHMHTHIHGGTHINSF